MKPLSSILLWLVGLLIIGQLFIWFLALGSGHNLTTDTKITFSRNLTLLVVLEVLLILGRKKFSK